MKIVVSLSLALAAMLAAQAEEGKVVRFEPGPEMEQAVQEAFILEEPGTVFEFAEGTYAFTGQLSLDLERATVRGAGMDKTIFDFKGQTSGSEGLYVTSDGVTVRDLAIVDTPGNCFKSNGADNLKLINVRTEWTGGPKETNGAYGLYPVSGENVLIDGCVAIGASDAGIYVGQTTNVIVRNSRAEYNVAGIEIENCHYADVYNCVATRNTGGLLVFDLPGLPMQKGRFVRLFNNKVVQNDTANFAPVGNIVASVPTGTGVMVMANSHVEIFDNEIGDNGTSNVSVVSYQVVGKPITDPEYYPYPESIYIHGNTFGRSGFAPKGELALAAAVFLGGKLPDIIWDGIVNEEKAVDGKLPAEAGIYIENNTKKDGGEVTFANLDAGTFLKDPTKMKVKQDIADHAGSLPRIAPVEIAGVD